ncbi:MAG: 50S ribosomal protein L1 [Chloroflexi bacterium]|nr:50S ribosomal protein L1 [Chloroflexota bacterium]GIW11760.1 MAG: 50S ribosomal protein L1 [Dehalococcoidia bacterium]
MPKHGKNYRAALARIEPGRLYTPAEAIALAKEIHYANFDETVEVHLRTGLDPRHADQQVRGVALLPHGLGKPVRVLVFTADPEGLRTAEEAGADYVGSDELIKRIEEGWLEFDIAIATPEMMGRVGRLGRILGRRGLMPNPRSGTVVPPADLGRAIRDARKGRVEFRLDRTANLHVPIGKVSFDDRALLDNLATIIDAIVKAKPSGAKGQYIRTATLATTMGPGIRLDLGPTLALKAA